MSNSHTHVPNTRIHNHTNLISGYIRQTIQTPFPIDLWTLIHSFCPLHFPQCLILFNFNCTKQVSLHLKDLFPNLLFKKHTSRRHPSFSMTRISIGISHTETISFFHDRSSTSNNSIDPVAWQSLIDNLPDDIDGTITTSKVNPTELSFSMIDHRVLDLIYEYFPLSQVRCHWQLDERISMKDTFFIVPSEFLRDGLGIMNLDESVKNVNVFYEDSVLCQPMIRYQICINPRNNVFHMILAPRFVLLSASTIDSKCGQDFEDDVVRLLRMFPFTNGVSELDFLSCGSTMAYMDVKKLPDGFEMTDGGFFELMEIIDRMQGRVFWADVVVEVFMQYVRA